MSDLMTKGILMFFNEKDINVLKIDDTHVFIEFEKGSYIDDEGKLKRLKDAFINLYNKGIKFRVKPTNT